MSTAAQQLSQWIETVHPDFFSTLFGYVARRQGAAQLRGAYLRGFGQDDDSSDLTEFTPTFDTGTVDVDTTDLISSQYTPATVDIPTLTSTDLLPPIAATSITAPDTGTLDVSTDNSGGFLSSLGSGISTAASSVASFLTSQQGLSDMAKLGTAYFQLQNTQANAALQTQLLQAQAQRAASGAAPLPVTYVTGTNGQLIPLYAVSSGGLLPAALANAVAAGASQYVTTPSGISGYTVPTNIIPALSGSDSLTSLLPWIALIVGGLILAKGLK